MSKWREFLELCERAEDPQEPDNEWKRFATVSISLAPEAARIALAAEEWLEFQEDCEDEYGIKMVKAILAGKGTGL